jgi:hypothetical protein
VFLAQMRKRSLVLSCSDFCRQSKGGAVICTEMIIVDCRTASCFRKEMRIQLAMASMPVMRMFWNECRRCWLLIIALFVADIFLHAACRSPVLLLL